MAEYIIPYTMKKNDIVTRIEKGTEITWTEMDNNLRTLKSLPNMFGYEITREYTGTEFEVDTGLDYRQSIVIPIKENMDFYDLYSIGYSILVSIFRTSTLNSDHNVFNISSDWCNSVVVDNLFSTTGAEIIIWI